MVSIIQENGKGRSVNMMQHKQLHLGDKHLSNHCYISIYIYASGIYAAVDFSYDMTYSGTGTLLHLSELVQPLIRPPPQMLLNATSDTNPRF